MPVYEFQCESGHTSDWMFGIEKRPDFVSCPECHRRADRIVSTPAIHTLETHLRGVRDPGVKINADGSYVDPNIFDHETGTNPVIRSKRDKQRWLDKLGLYEKEPSKERATAMKRRVHFT